MPRRPPRPAGDEQRTGQRPARRQAANESRPEHLVRRPATAPEDGHDQGEERNGHGRVQADADEMIAARIEAREHVFQFQEHPGQGLVHPQQKSGPGPADLAWAKAPKRCIVEEVLVVVECEEAVVQSGKKSRRGHHRKGDDDPPAKKEPKGFVTLRSWSCKFGLAQPSADLFQRSSLP